MTDDRIQSPDPQQPPNGSPPNDITDAGITDDPIIAAEEGQAYQAPVDPPIAGRHEDGARIAAGFAPHAQAEPYDADHHRALELGDDEMTARVRETLLADSLGSHHVDRLRLETVGGIARIEGLVEDLDVQEHLIGVVAHVTGITEVRDRLRLSEDDPQARGRDVRVGDG
ncbi:hypothetical protein BH24CHL9_BH24CHL9_16710 [soil metagenome]